MANISQTPFMNLPNPVPGVDPGPDYASNQFSCFNIVDQHNHSSGSGQQIQPNGLNISTDLPFNSNNATTLRTTRFVSQTSPIASSSPDVGCLYVSGNELYYNDTSGNQVQITLTGAVNATSSGISSGTASAAFSSTVLVVKASSTTGANVKMLSALLTNSGNLSNTLTLQAPTLSGSITQTFPPIPITTSFMTMDSSGNMGTSISTVGGISGSNIASATITQANMASASIGTAQLIDANVTKPKLAALGQQVSLGCGSYAVTSFSVVTNLSKTITTTGRPVFVAMIPDNSAGAAISFVTGSLEIDIRRDATNIAPFFLNNVASAPTYNAAGPYTIDVGASAGTHTYDVTAQFSGAGNAAIENYKLIVYEL